MTRPVRREPREWLVGKQGLTLKWRLSLSFMGITVLAVLVVAAALIPLLARHYAAAEQTYLAAAAERAVRDLSQLNWQNDSTELQRRVASLASLSQTRVRAADTSGTVVADSGMPPAGGAATGSGVEPLPSPFGSGLFGGSENAATLGRSNATVDRPVVKEGKLLGTVSLSNPPDYGGAALRDAATALGLSALLAVIVAGLVGWLVSSRLSAPIRALTEVTDRMAAGDLTVRASVGRRDEVGQLADSFNSMADEVEKTVAMRQRFVADAAHEFGTPLTALQANLELAQVRAGDREERGLIEAAVGESWRLERLSSDLLRLSRLEARQPREERQSMDLAQLVRHLGDAVASRAEQKELELTLDLPDEAVWASVYPDQLQTAFGNLVDNALKFTPAGGAVALGARAPDGRATLWVKDTGPGIPPEDRAKLFERFHRGQNAAGLPGSGLGLAIVRAVMDLHEGTVEVSTDGNGSRFELGLPAEPGRSA